MSADVSIDLGPSCGERFRLGRPSDYACALSAQVLNSLNRFAFSAHHLALLSARAASHLRSCGATEFINKEEACIQVRCSVVQSSLRSYHASGSFLLQSGMIVWRFVMNLVVVVADGNLFDACLIAASAAISNGKFPFQQRVNDLPPLPPSSP